MATTNYVEKYFDGHSSPPPGVSGQDRFVEAVEPEGFFRSPAGLDGFWVFTSYDTIREIFQNPELFSSKAVDVSLPVGATKFVPLNLDPPDHTKYRQVMAPDFSPASVAKLEPLVRSICREHVERLRDAPRCEFLADFAFRFPTQLFQKLLGIPSEMNDQFMGWVAGFLHGTDPAEKMASIHAINDYMGLVIDEQRRDPGDNLVTSMLSRQIDGRPPTREELQALVFLLFLAGHDTVPAVLGFVWKYLAEHADARQRLRDDPSLIPAAVEELLRFYTIAPPGRLVTQDVEFHGCPLKAGDRVVLATPAGDRDPAHFPDAHQVVLDRQPNAHFAFGAGPHRCVGSHLARLEIRVAIEEWHAVIPDYQIEPGAVLQEHGGVIGLVDLPLILGK